MNAPALGPYVAETLLTRDIVGELWKGVDRNNGSPVMIRRLPLDGLSERSRICAEHEATILQRLGPALPVQLRYVELRADALFVVRTYIEGETLREILGRGRLEVDVAIELAVGILKALSTLHAHDVLHLDLKPDNIIVGKDRSVVLIDFGLSHHFTSAGVRPHGGTALYMSPEQAGLVRQDVGPRADLYSVGVVIYEMLSGRAPFRGESASEVLRSHIADPIPPVEAAHPDRRLRGLDQIIHHLLQKDPRQRYQRASAVLADLVALGDLGEGDAIPSLALGHVEAGGRLVEPPFVGRQREISQLLAAADDPTGVIVIRAASGAGKTRLLEEFALQAWQRGATVIQAATPAHGIGPSPLLQQLGQRVTERIGTATLSGRLAEHLPTLGRIMPAFSIESDDHPPAAAALPALRAFMEALGELDQRTVLLLDDCQEADVLTLALIRSLDETPVAGLLLVAAVRTDGNVHSEAEVRRSEVLSEDRGAEVLGRVKREVVLDTLPRAELEALLQAMAGSLPGPAIDLVARISGGNAFLAVEALRGLAEEGILIPAPPGWKLDAARQDDVTVSTRAAAVLTRRLDALTADTLGVLTAAAVIGRAFSVERLATLVDGERETLFRGLEDGKRVFALWTDGRGTWSFMHDKIRESLLARLAPDDRRLRHLRLARILQADPASSPYDLCHHLVEAGALTEAVAPALQSAEDALERHALDVAARHYDIALQGMPARDPARVSVLKKLADVLMVLGSYDEADARLVEAIELASDAFVVSELLAARGSRRRRTLDPKARAYLEEALSRVGHPLPPPGWPRIRATLHAVLRQALPERFTGQRRGNPERDLLAADAAWDLAQTAAVNHDFSSALWALMTQLELAERHGPSDALCRAYAEHAVVVSQLPAIFQSRARQYADRAVTLSRQLEGDLVRGCAEGRAGFVSLVQGRLDQAFAHLEASMHHHRWSSDQSEISSSGHWLAVADFLLGHPHRAAAHLLELYETNRRMGDDMRASGCLLYLSRIHGGALSDAQIDDEMQQPIINHTLTVAHRTSIRGMQSLARGDSSAAAEAFEEADAIASTVRIVRDVGRAWTATAHRWAAARAPAEAHQHRAHHLRLARRAARDAERASSLVARPHGLRERALLALERGHVHRARAFFERALKLCEEQGNRYDHAWTLYERGRVGHWAGWPGADRDLRAGREAFLAMGMDPTPLDHQRPPTLLTTTPPAPLGLADRLAGALSAGRSLAGALTLPALFDAVHEAALKLLRAQHGAVLICDDEAPWSRVVGSSLSWSQSLVERVRAERRVHTVEEAPAATAHESLLLGSVRSVLAAPIVARGRVSAVFYVTHDQVAGLFGPDEVALAEFIAAIAGAAMENAFGFSEIRALSDSLEDERGRLESALHEKQIMLAEIHHRVGNNMQIIASLLNLQSGNAPDEASRMVLDDMLRRVHAMAMLQDLMYSASDYGSIPLHTYARTLIENILHSFGSPPNIRVDLDLAPLTVAVSRAIPCGLILNELVCNSLHHAYPEGRGGTVRVTTDTADDTIRLVVADDGIDIDVEPETAESSGLTIVRALAGQINATLTWSGPGTCATIQFPR